VKYATLCDENAGLRQNVLDVEQKNRELLARLETNLHERAREYKERAVDALSGSPLR
jgi:hypothetical protein